MLDIILESVNDILCLSTACHSGLAASDSTDTGDPVHPGDTDSAAASRLADSFDSGLATADTADTSDPVYPGDTDSAAASRSADAFNSSLGTADTADPGNTVYPGYPFTVLPPELNQSGSETAEGTGTIS